MTDLEELARKVEALLPYVMSGYFHCNGDKCRHPTCASCFGDDAAADASEKAEAILAEAMAALRALAASQSTGGEG